MMRTQPMQRQKFAWRHGQGDTYAQIAADEHVSVGCVRYWCRRQQRGGTYLTVPQPHVHHLLEDFDSHMADWILLLRRAHPHWGPDRIRSDVVALHASQVRSFPSNASIGRFLHQFPEFQRPPRRAHQRERVRQPQAVHQRWQVDFKLGICLDQGDRITLHTIRDPVGEACLAARIYGAGHKGATLPKVTDAEVRATLRWAFTSWRTLPDEVQTDNEPDLFGKPQDTFPSLFTLWLTGLGITHLMTRPGRPTDNAEVERCQRTITDYAIVGNEGLSVPDLQRTLDDAVHKLAFDLTSTATGCHGQTPVVAHPELLCPRRRYDPAWELSLFDMQRVDVYLATISFKRKVNKTGQVSIGGQHVYYTVGRHYARHEVIVRFDPRDRTFVFADAEAPETPIARQPARGLERHDILGEPEEDSPSQPQQLSLFPLS